MKFNWLIGIASSVFKPFFGLLSNEIKNTLTTFIKELYVKAEKTENIWDDFFVKMLADILNIDL